MIPIYTKHNKKKTQGKTTHKHEVSFNNLLYFFFFITLFIHISLVYTFLTLKFRFSKNGISISFGKRKKNLIFLWKSLLVSFSNFQIHFSVLVRKKKKKITTTKKIRTEIIHRLFSQAIKFLLLCFSTRNCRSTSSNTPSLYNNKNNSQGRKDIETKTSKGRQSIRCSFFLERISFCVFLLRCDTMKQLLWMKYEERKNPIQYKVAGKDFLFYYSLQRNQ